MVILKSIPNGMLVQDSTSYVNRREMSLGPGSTWSRRLPDMDGDYDPDNGAYSQDESDLLDGNFWRDDEEFDSEEDETPLAQENPFSPSEN